MAPENLYSIEILATGKNSSNCSEESFTNPVADNYFSIGNIYSFCSEETIMKNNTPSTKEIIPWNKGRKLPTLTEEHRQKISKAMKGHVGYNKGKHLSEVAKLKISMANKGRIMTAEQNEKNSLAHKGQIPWNKGKKRIYIISEGTKQKISYALNEMFPACPNIPILCKCGCNAVVWGGSVFVSGHNSKGVPKTEEHKRKIGLSNKGKCLGRPSPMKGKKKSAETLKKMSLVMVGRFPGKKNPSWIDGRSFLPYCYKFNNYVKEQIRERDNHTCQLCEVVENGRKLDVHHVHYDKENCNPDLITLCKRCNLKVNHNRDYWEAFFMQILMRRGLA